MLNSDLYRLHRSGTYDRAFAEVSSDRRQGEQGFLLLGLVVAIFLILLVLGVAAPKVAHELRREREVETIHRGNQYVRAIQEYYKKMGHYPGSIEQLQKTNNIRFLRQQYVDPMTGKADWRLIHVGEAKTTVKGFFGQPLAGIESSGLGSAAGTSSPGGTGLTSGSSSNSLSNSPSGMSSGGLGSTPGSSIGTSGTSSGSGSSNSSTGLDGQSNGPFVGVGLVKDGNSISVLNEQTTYATWEFIYDPRIEQMLAKSSIFGGGMTSTNSTGLGSSSDKNSNSGKTGSGTDGGLNMNIGPGAGSVGAGGGASNGSSGTSTSPQ